MAVARDLLGRVARVVDHDLLRRNHRPHSGRECVTVEPSPRVVIAHHELHQVERRQVAGRVIEEHVLGAGIRRADAVSVRAGMPVVDRRVELHAGVAAHMGPFGDQPHELARFEGVHHAVIRDRPGMPLTVIEHGPHEVVRHADTVVRVLEEHRRVGRAGKRPIIARVNQRPCLPLLLNLAVDEVDDVWMVDIEHDHFCGAAGLATGFDDSGERVVALHKRHRTGRGAAATQ